MSNSYSNANKQYRDTVFRDYFNNQKRLLSLCNAVLETKYTNEKEVEINTLEGSFFSGQKNDVSCLLRNNFLVMVEHQSSSNPNMPFRFLSYVAQLFNNMVKDKEKIYVNEEIELPDPQFFVFYDGNKKEPIAQELRLSDCLCGTSHKLELIVNVYNVNYGLEQPLFERCQYLRDYSTLVGKVKQGIKAGMTRRQAIIEAIEWCVKNGIMGDYLPTKRDEVFGMLDFQWDFDEAKVAWEHKAAREREEGIKLGRIEGVESIVINMLHNGRTVEEIHKDTKLPIERINELAKF